MPVLIKRPARQAQVNVPAQQNVPQEQNTTPEGTKTPNESGVADKI